MFVRCQRCGKESPKGTLWCPDCRFKLEGKLVSQSEDTTDLKHLPLEEEDELISSIRDHPEPIPKRLYLLPLIGFFCFIFIFGLVLVYIVSTPPSEFVEGDFAGVNTMVNDDFWFEGNYLNTSDGWCFFMEKGKEYVISARVLGIQKYIKTIQPYRPIDIFSPIDLLLGVDEIKDSPDEFSYTLRYQYRSFWTSYHGYNPIELYYFQTHTGTHHLIPHTIEVLNLLNTISVDDTVYINGSLVNLYGTRENESYTWETDTKIGNYDPEIILVDEIQIE